jgi:hypothetical protein
MSADDQFKINLNQNLWGLVVGLGALGAAEHFNLCVLFWFGVLLSSWMSISVMATTIPYTINYWKYKMKRAREHGESP